MQTRPTRSGTEPDETIERFRQIVLAEQRQGFRDRVVIGGLSRLAERWLATGGAARLRSALQHLREYSRAEPGDRQTLLEQAMALLDGEATPTAHREPRPTRDGGRTNSRKAPSVDDATPLTSPPSKTRRGGETSGTGSESVPVGRSVRRSARRTAAGNADDGVPARRVRAAPGGGSESLVLPLHTVKGIGPARAQRLRRLGLETIEDLLFFTPRRHVDYRDVRAIAELEEGVPQTIVASVWSVQTAPTRSRLVRIQATLNDGSGSCRALWFRARDYLSAELPSDEMVILSGTPEVQQGVMTFRDPEWEPYGRGEPMHTARLVPVYALTEGINDRWLRRLIKEHVDRYVDQIVDPLPIAVRDRHDLLDLPMAIAQAHFPDSPELLARANRRLAFDELILIQLGAELRRRGWEHGGTAPVLADPGVTERFASSLPFSLTGAQRRALGEITADLGRPRPMHRLLQGDVGSGKTVVAAATMLVALANGYQAALMAPTEILAEQHFQTIQRLTESAGTWLWPDRPRPVTVGLLTGGRTGSAREVVTAGAADGTIDIVVGTHALIQENVMFARLGVAIIDEQHRFGVLQRATLRAKGGTPHTLVMTATPIPRTLALTIYGDLESSVIDELPAGRQRIVTKCLKPSERQRAYQFIHKQVHEGRQAYVICPLVEESEKLELKAATAEYERLQRDVFPSLRLGLLHGRMKSAEKDAVMSAFQRGEIDILVSTAVVEVGVDVPNATVMLIEGADRFGLAQLHQFRGRVGRGEHQSYCILVSESRSGEALDRLAIVERTHDGFELAEADLRLRGPGEFFGTRQSGIPELRYASLTDQPLIEETRAVARAIVGADPELTNPEHRHLAVRLRRFWQGAGDL